ncbi:hypothetical protein KKF34_12790 [Myxococcota bacterium]|nr:hypothetical protein [Myxococcota bacterium]MBU1380596.1 hypothetical protein [Myxococcota bacterium]MBU1497743.1 hypothetical protein [Myxococcota bacterium]
MKHANIILISVFSMFFMSSCLVRSAKKKVRTGRAVYAQVKVAAQSGSVKKAALPTVIAIALAGKGIKQTAPFSDAFFLYQQGDTAGSAAKFCQGLMRNKIKNPAIALGAMTAITIIGERNKLEFHRFLKLMRHESKKCVRHYVRE